VYVFRIVVFNLFVADFQHIDRHGYLAVERMVTVKVFWALWMDYDRKQRVYDKPRSSCEANSVVACEASLCGLK